MLQLLINIFLVLSILGCDNLIENSQQNSTQNIINTIPTESYNSDGSSTAEGLHIRKSSVSVMESAFGAVGNGIKDDYDAIAAAISSCSKNGGGDVFFPMPSSGYKTTRTINVPDGVRLIFEGMGSRNVVRNYIVPTSAVTGAAIRTYQGRGIGLIGACVDMTNMPNGAIGIEIRSSWWLHSENCHVINCNGGSSSIGWKIWSNSSDDRGTYWNTYINCSAKGTNGTMWRVLGENGGRPVTTQLMINLVSYGGVYGFDFDYTGSGMTMINVNSEFSSSDAIDFSNASSPTALNIIGGEISSGGWGLTGDSMIYEQNLIYSTNASGNRNTNVISAVPHRDKITVSASDTIPCNVDTLRLTGDDSAVTMTSNPQIATPINNATKYLTITGGSNFNTITLVDGNGLRLNGDIILGLEDSITLVFDNSFGDWVELGRSGSVDQSFTKIGLVGKKEITISGGTVAIVGGTYTVDTESDAASDDLDTINGGSEGDILILSSANGGRDIVVKQAAGNIFCGADFTMDSEYDRIVLQKTGNNWVALAKHDNGF